MPSECLQIVKKWSIYVSGTSQSEPQHLSNRPGHVAFDTTRPPTGEHELCCFVFVLTGVRSAEEHSFVLFWNVRLLHGTRTCFMGRRLCLKLAYRHCQCCTTTCCLLSRPRTFVFDARVLFTEDTVVASYLLLLNRHDPGTSSPRRHSCSSLLFVVRVDSLPCRIEVFNPVVHACTCQHSFWDRGGLDRIPQYLAAPTLGSA